MYIGMKKIYVGTPPGVPVFISGYAGKEKMYVGMKKYTLEGRRDAPLDWRVVATERFAMLYSA